jgi:hypothetical protein
MQLAGALAIPIAAKSGLERKSHMPAKIPLKRRSLANIDQQSKVSYGVRENRLSARRRADSTPSIQISHQGTVSVGVGNNPSFVSDWSTR